MPFVECPACAEPNPDGARLCGMCRTTLVEDDQHDGGRIVTVVTSDLKGSTALGERLDPESPARGPQSLLQRDACGLESHGGSIEKIIGDAIVAVFGSRSATRTTRSARSRRRRRASAPAMLNDELERVWAVRLVNRTGVATGSSTSDGTPRASTS
jgi:class 3 adenylate cyclase